MLLVVKSSTVSRVADGSTARCSSTHGGRACLVMLVRASCATRYSARRASERSSCSSPETVNRHGMPRSAWSWAPKPPTTNPPTATDMTRPRPASPGPGGARNAVTTKKMSRAGSSRPNHRCAVSCWLRVWRSLARVDGVLGRRSPAKRYDRPASAATTPGWILPSLAVGGYASNHG
jgi:hypothetical protein